MLWAPTSISGYEAIGTRPTPFFDQLSLGTTTLQWKFCAAKLRALRAGTLVMHPNPAYSGSENSHECRWHESCINAHATLHR